MTKKALSHVIGYFIPEFPSQTHVFFWREREALKKLGIFADLVSTRHPRQKNLHSWTSQTILETFYLFPPRIKFLIGGLLLFLRGGVPMWRKVWSRYRQSEAESLKMKIRLFALALIGMELAYYAHKRGWKHIHVHSCADSANIAMFASCIGDFTYSLTLHSSILESYGGNQKLKWSCAAFGTVVSQKALKMLEERLSGSLPSPVVCASMGVDLEKFQREKATKGIQKNQTVHLFSCGRLHASKGHDLIIRAISLLHQRGFNVALRIAGGADRNDDGTRKELEQLIEQLSLRNHVALLGTLAEEKVKEELEAADIFVLASRRCSGEAHPVSIMEAMAMELPIIATDVGGIPELVEHEVNGLLVASDEAEEIAKAIQKLTENPGLAQSFGQKSRRKIEQSFHSGISATAIVDCLKFSVEGF